jgi:pilus assembly protein CpaE
VTVADQQRLRVAVVTTLDQIEQEWLSQVAQDPQVSWLDRSAVLPAALEIVQRSRPDVVIVDRPANEAESFIRQVYTALPATACVAIVSQADTQVLRRLMLAGARDVVARPFKAADLVQSIVAAAQLEQERHTRNPSAAEPVTPGRGKFVAVVSPKGGAGATFVSANLAILLHQLTAGRVAVADFNMQFGHLGTHLNIFARHSLQHLIENYGEIDDAMLATVLQQHSSGVHVLLAPTSPEVAGELTSDQTHVILDQLLARYSYLVADTWGVIDDVSLAILGRADEVIVVCTPEIPALKNVKFFLEYAREHELTRGRVSIVLNRFPSVDGVSLEDVQQHLRHEVSASIPSAGQLVTYSVNRGVPVALSHPQSWVGQSLQQLAAHVAGEDAAAISSAPKKGKGIPGIASPGRGLFGLLRKPA